MTLRAVLMDMHALAAELLTFECTYGRRSETCSAAYVRGEEPADDQRVLDFGEWASVYRTWLARQAGCRNAEQGIQCHTTGLRGLIRVLACIAPCVVVGVVVINVQGPCVLTSLRYALPRKCWSYGFRSSAL